MTTRPDTIVEVAVTRYGVDRDIARRATNNLYLGAVGAYVLSGKMGSGKDFWAPRVAEMDGHWPATQYSYATALKQEVNDLIFRVVAAPTVADAVTDVAAMGWPVHDPATVCAVDLVSRLWDRTDLDDWDAHHRDQMPEESRLALRALLQRYGTEGRRGQDPQYWVRQTAPVVMGMLADGQSVYMTDCRFPNEADLALDLGWTLIRLDISPEVQRERLRARDGIDYDWSALNHVSETALDDYPFPARVDNNGTVEATTTALETLLRTSSAAVA